MTPEKASTLRLLREGIGNPVNVIESNGSDHCHEVRAQLLEDTERNHVPILFLITSLAFLEARPCEELSLVQPGSATVSSPYYESDGWTPVDFLKSLIFIEGGGVRIFLERIRGRAVNTEVVLRPCGELLLRTQGRGKSAQRWLHFVKGQSHLTPVAEGI